MIGHPLSIKLRQPPGGFEVGIKDIVPILIVNHGVGFGAGLDPCVINQDINATKGLNRFRQKILRRLWIPNIQRQTQYLVACRG